MWFPANNRVKPNLQVRYSISTINNGILTYVDPEHILDLTDSDNDGIIDSEDSDPLGLDDPSADPGIFDDDSIPDSFPTTIYDKIRICIAGRCYESDLPPTTKAAALEQIANKIAADYAAGLISYSAYWDAVNQDLIIIDPATGLAPTPITATVIINGQESNLVEGVIPTPTPVTTEFGVTGFTGDLTGANGTYVVAVSYTHLRAHET